MSDKTLTAVDVLLSPLEQEEMIGRLTAMASALDEWYQKEGRQLPWRTDSTPYHVWLSEIMLQQTRVEAVIPYYHRFLEAVPDIAALSEADDMQLVKLWEGLGYYSRVRNLKKGARQVMEQFGGQLPGNIRDLRSVCGIGEYTAGAIGSIAFGIREPAVDGNLLRVTSRLLAAEGDITRPQVKKAFHDILYTAMSLFPASLYPGDFNQAMMDLGSGVCTPSQPDCTNCPVREYCLACMRDQAELFPVKSAKKARRVEEKTVLVIICEDHLLLRQRAANGLLAGLWEFPSVDGKLTVQQTARLLESMGIETTRLVSLSESRHLFTHIEWQMTGVLAICKKGCSFPDGWQPVTLADLQESYPVPSALRVYRKAAVEWLSGFFCE